MKKIQTSKKFLITSFFHKL